MFVNVLLESKYKIMKKMYKNFISFYNQLKTTFFQRIERFDIQMVGDTEHLLFSKKLT